MSLGPLDTSLLEGMLEGEGTVRAGYGSKGKGIIRAGYVSKKMFDSTSSFN